MFIDVKQQQDEAGWTVARFPSHGIRQQFLEQVDNWNRVDVLPRIAVLPLMDGTRVRFRSEDWGRLGIESLVDSYGGLVCSGSPAA